MGLYAGFETRVAPSTDRSRVLGAKHNSNLDLGAILIYNL